MKLKSFYMNIEKWLWAELREGPLGIVFFSLIVVSIVCGSFYKMTHKPEQKLITIEKVETKSNETLSHKAGTAVKKSGSEFFRGLFGFDSKGK